MHNEWSPRFGATLLGDGQCRFRVWAPHAKTLQLRLLGDNECLLPMKPSDHGYYETVVDDVAPGQLYKYCLDGVDYPDPASRSQPRGVFGPSEVLDSRFAWTDAGWAGLPIDRQIMYELHVGTYTQEGTFDALIAHLDALRDLGVNSLELMPVAQFPGERNWGYDGVFLFAVQQSYGGALGLKRFVDACHARGIAVLLDTVYNHFGPEGNCVSCYGPYTTDNYKTPWGEAINVDGPYSDEVREFFTENALFWLDEYHIDGLRLDATHYIFDFSPFPFLRELVGAVHEYGRSHGRAVQVIAESDRNDANLVRDRAVGGDGMDAQWLDDFHHTLHTVVTHENFAYYKDFGAFDQLVKAVRDGFVYTGQYAPTRKRRHGTPSADIEGSRFVVFIQNHDQIGNRMPNDRIVRLFSFDQFKLAVGVVLLSPYVPLLFMGDEYGETARFEFFADYDSEELTALVRKGRIDTFGHLLGNNEEPPDPADVETFRGSKLRHERREQGNGPVLLAYHRELIRLRATNPVLADLSKRNLHVIGYDDAGVFLVQRSNEYGQVFAIFNFDEKVVTRDFPVSPGAWRLLFDSSEPRWRSPGAPEPAQSAGVAATLDSTGKLTLNLPPQGFIVYELVSQATSAQG